MFCVLMCFLPPRMRRVILVASVLGLLMPDNNKREELAKKINRDRHIADDTSAFYVGFLLGDIVWKNAKNQLTQITNKDWLEEVDRLISPFTNYDHQVVVDDLASVREHLLHG